MSPQDLRHKIRGKSRRNSKSKSRSRSRSYSPPKPPAHPSRAKSSAKRRTSDAIDKHSKSAARDRSRSKSKERDRLKSRQRSVVDRENNRHTEKDRKKKKSRPRGSSTSSSSDDNEEELRKQREKIKKLLSKMDVIAQEKEAAEREKSRKRKKSGTGESRRSGTFDTSLDKLTVPDDPWSARKRNKSSRDSLESRKSLISPDIPPAPVPLIAKTTFKPKPEPLGTQLAGYVKCRICKSYYPDDEDNARLHLSQHLDRVFLVSLPCDTYYYSIEDAIGHLIVKLKINKNDLSSKIKNNNLIKNPSNLAGFSCDICQMLDTNNEEVLQRHLKDECNIKDKAERSKHIIYFCRGCQGRFDNNADLLQHISYGNCWPDQAIIKNLYEQAARGALEVMKPPSTLNIKQEIMEQTVSSTIQIKKERFEQVRQDQLTSRMSQGAANNILTPLTPDFGGYNINFNAPETDAEPFCAYSNSQGSETAAQQPSTTAEANTISSADPSVKDLQLILNKFKKQQASSSADVGNPVPQIFNQYNSTDAHQSSIDVGRPVPQIFNQYNPSDTHQNAFDGRGKGNPNDPRKSVGVQIREQSEEPSPIFSPVPVRPSPARPSAAIPPPSTPLPSSVNDLFKPYTNIKTNYLSSPEIIASEEPSVKAAACPLSCSRLRCLWTDLHVDNCKRLQIIKVCEDSQCNFFSLHKDGCKRREFYCNGQKVNKEYRWYTPQDLKAIKIIPNTVIDGSYPNKTCEEKPNVPMRLLSRRTNKSLQDPRKFQKIYPFVEICPEKAVKVRGRRDGSGFKRGTVVSTWSRINKVRLENGENPHIESDHDSDIEFCD